MRFVLFFSFMLLMVVGCADEKLPKDVLPPGKMEKIIWDVIQADQFIQGYVNFKHKPDEYAAINRKWYEKACSLNNISPARFATSMQYYYDHPDLMKPLLDSLSRKHQVTSPTSYPGQIIDSATHSKRMADTSRRRMMRKLPKGDTISVIEPIP